MFNSFSPGLHAGNSEKIILKSVSVDVVFNNLLCETAMLQAYQNLEENPIEAVYTFPLDSRAVLLSLKVLIGGRELHGVVKARAAAEEQYEDALADGDAAIMLERLDSGMYTMNVGNILAGETVSVAIAYAQLYDWQGNALRFLLPMTIAPRYGDPENAGLQPHQIPETSLLAENRCQIRLTLTENLSDAVLDSPSHQIAVTRSGTKTLVVLASGQAFMDRDFILNIRLNIRTERESRDMIMMGHDLENGYVALASFAPSLPVDDEPGPRSVKILVDCSGSMSGDAIDQARQALNDILKNLRPLDYFNIFTFGNSCTAFFDRQEPADKGNITAVRRKLRSLEADMGGTEMGLAFRVAVDVPGPAISQDILLITDGEIYQGDEVIAMVRETGHRVFAVGVGSAVSESFVRRLAHETGGACELVSPNENMAERIVRQFKRIYAPMAEKAEVRWPSLPQRTVPRAVGPVFDGDTLHVFGFFKEKPQGLVRLDLVLSDGREIFRTLTLSDDVQLVKDGCGELPGILARCGIQAALKEEPETAALDLALRYQLISPHTRYLVVAERTEADKEKGRKLPVLRKVPGMMAAGHAGVGSVVMENRVQYCIEDKPYGGSAPSYIRYQRSAAPRTQKDGVSPLQFVHNCNHLYRFTLWPNLKIVTYADLEHCGPPKSVLAALKTIAERHDKTAPESMVVTLFLHILMHSPMIPYFRFMLRLSIRRAFKKYRPNQTIIRDIEETFADITMQEWGPSFPMEIGTRQGQDDHA